MSKPCCENPFNTLIVAFGTASVCCDCWIVCKVKYDPANPAAVWNCKQFQEVRRSVLDGSYRYCQRCPYIRANLFAKKEKPTDHNVVMERGPTNLTIVNDQSCNLKCFPCVGNSPKRVYHRNLGNKEAALAEQKQLFQVFGKDLKTLSLTFLGDPFGTWSYREFLKSINVADYPELKLSLTTNGLEIPKHWDSIGLCHQGRIKEMRISVDAASARTYERIRVGGKWVDLIKTLDFIAEVRKTYPFPLTLNMCVFAWNYREIPEFADLAEKYGAVANLQAMRGWGDSFTQEELSFLTVFERDHPEYGEFQRVINSVRNRVQTLYLDQPIEYLPCK